MFSLETWEKKLIFLQKERESIRSIDTTGFDSDRMETYHRLLRGIESKVQEYQELIEHLGGME